MASVRQIKTAALQEPHLQTAALALYGSVWSFVPPGIEQARQWGSEWFGCTTPTYLFDGGDMLAHVGRIDCQFAVDGARVRVAALHAVCVQESQRGRGYGRACMEAALDVLDSEGVGCTILWSEKLDFYAKFGFSPQRESMFVCRRPPAAERSPCGRLDFARPEHVERLCGALKRRVPVAGQGPAAADDGWHFLIDLAFSGASQVHAVELLDDRVIVFGELRDTGAGRVLRIDDVIGATMPSLARIIGAFVGDGEGVRAVELMFSPDRFEGNFVATEHPAVDCLLVRGTAPWGAGAFAISPYSRT